MKTGFALMKSLASLVNEDGGKIRLMKRSRPGRSLAPQERLHSFISVSDFISPARGDFI